MANRAERRRQMRAHAAHEQMKTLQPQVEMSKDELKRIERELKDIQEGRAGFTGMMAANQEKFRQKMEVRDQVRKIIEHNGITAQDLDDAREAGRQEGFKQAAEPIIKCCYQEEFGRTPTEGLEARKKEVGEALASFMLGHFKDRARYNAALEAIDDPDKAEAFKEKWQDGRTSLNNIGGVAHSIGKKLLAAGAR